MLESNRLFWMGRRYIFVRKDSKGSRLRGLRPRTSVGFRVTGGVLWENVVSQRTRAVGGSGSRIQGSTAAALAMVTTLGRPNH